MPFAVIHHFPGGTQDQYEASIGAVHPSRDELPEGQIHHVAGPVEGGWTITAVHESKESWENFRDNTLMPKMQAGIDGGFQGPPESTEFEVYNLQP